jgi:peptidyl-prolyl cis-trans isomerase A (cyclophilin A)
MGDFTIALFEDRAPLTCNYFSTLIRDGIFLDSNVFRIVADGNQPADAPCPIHVVQLGPAGCMEFAGQPIMHEGTDKTGLSHKKWTVSAARVRVNELFGSFFVCMQDEPTLNFGGKRQPDGHGFAAFGEVVSGFDALERIYQSWQPEEWLQNVIPIQSVELIEGD